jgi:hypothetical protein
VVAVLVSDAGGAVGPPAGQEVEHMVPMAARRVVR